MGRKESNQTNKQNKHSQNYYLSRLQRISSDKASNLPKRDVRFILLKWRLEKLGTFNKYIYTSRRCTIAPEFVYLKRCFFNACNNSTSFWMRIYFDHQLCLLFSNIYGNQTVKQG